MARNTDVVSEMMRADDMLGAFWILAESLGPFMEGFLDEPAAETMRHLKANQDVTGAEVQHLATSMQAIIGRLAVNMADRDCQAVDRALITQRVSAQIEAETTEKVRVVVELAGPGQYVYLLPEVLCKGPDPDHPGCDLEPDYAQYLECMGVIQRSQSAGGSWRWVIPADSDLLK